MASQEERGNTKIGIGIGIGKAARCAGRWGGGERSGRFHFLIAEHWSKPKQHRALVDGCFSLSSHPLSTRGSPRYKKNAPVWKYQSHGQLRLR